MRRQFIESKMGDARSQSCQEGQNVDMLKCNKKEHRAQECFYNVCNSRNKIIQVTFTSQTTNQLKCNEKEHRAQECFYNVCDPRSKIFQVTFTSQTTNHPHFSSAEIYSLTRMRHEWTSTSQGATSAGRSVWVNWMTLNRLWHGSTLKQSKVHECTKLRIIW